MSNEAKRDGANLFAAALATSMSATIADAAQSPWLLEAVSSGDIPSFDGTPIHFRLTVEGALRGECFIEFYESQVAALVSNILKRPVRQLGDDHKEILTKIVSTALTSAADSLQERYGKFSFNIDRVAGLAFGGMFVVPIVSQDAPSAMQILLYFGSQLLDMLSSSAEAGVSGRQDLSPVPAYNLKMVLDVELNVSLRFGQRQLPLREVLELASGSIIELDRMVDEPVELFLDGKLIARGEAVVVDGNYGLRVTEIPQPITSHLLN
jgi:flagellar motor switch protein FliN